MSFTDVRPPRDTVIAGPGRGFETAQGRLGPGRIHHRMRLIGRAERALEPACRRATGRTAFGEPLANLGGNRERTARTRIAIDQARLAVLHTAWPLDTAGPDEVHLGVVAGLGLGSYPDGRKERAWVRAPVCAVPIRSSPARRPA